MSDCIPNIDEFLAGASLLYTSRDDSARYRSSRIDPSVGLACLEVRDSQQRLAKHEFLNERLARAFYLHIASKAEAA